MTNPFEDPESMQKMAEQMMGLKRFLIPLVIILVLIGALATSVYTVEPEGKAVVKRVGKVVGVRDPGLHFRMPFGIDTAHFVPTERVLKEEFGFRTVEAGQRSRYAKSGGMRDESLMLTGDLNVIDVEWVVQYFIRDPDKWMHRVRDPVETLRDVSEAVMRQIVGNRLGRDVLTIGRVEVAAQARDKLQEILTDYDMGVHVSNVEMQDVTPPEKVKPAFNAVNEARQQKERLINEAERKRNQQIPRAEGEARQKIAQAEGYKLEAINQARGSASRFTAVLHEYTNAPAITRRRLYLETAERVLPRAGRITVVDGDSPAPLPLLHLDEGRGGTNTLDQLLQAKGGAK